MESLEVTTREEAKCNGLTKYYTGKPCPHGHNGLRMVSNGRCVSCLKKRWADRPKEEKHKAIKDYASSLKKEVMAHYGGRCACCGESELIFLNIDHVNQDGAAHRRKMGGKYFGGTKLYAWLKKNGFPEGYRVLCFNCNFAIFHLGECPHSLPPQPRRDD